MRRSELSNRLRAELMDAATTRTPEQNVRVSLALAELAVALHRARTGESRAAALRAIERLHQVGRRPSKVMER